MAMASNPRGSEAPRSDADELVLSLPPAEGRAGLAVQLVRLSDRWAHRIGPFTVVGSGGADKLLMSVEGEADQPWPSSPALQQLHVEQRGVGVTVALLVGMAGRSHWSLSIETDPERRQIVFDAACRFQSEPQGLGSLYLAVEKLPLGEDGRVLLGGAEPWGVLSADVSDACPTLVTVRGRELQVAPRQVPRGDCPATVRWRYVVSPAK